MQRSKQNVKTDEGNIQVPKRKRRRLAWNESSEVALLDLWPERVEELRRHRKTRHIYADMASDLAKLGFMYSARDVQVKIQNFTQRYRKEKAAMGMCGGSPSTWSYYGKVHQIIAGFKTNILVLESNEADYSNASPCGLLPSSTTPLPSSSSPLPLNSPASPLPCTSAFEPKKKKGMSYFKSTVLKKFEELSSDVTEHLKTSEENEKELIKIEKEKADCLKKITKDNEELKDALISFLQKH